MNQQLGPAIRAFQAGDFAGAVLACDQLLSANPGEPEAWHIKAMCLGRLGRVDEAVAAFQSALAVHPRPAAVNANLANTLVRAGRHDDSIGPYRAAVAQEPNFGEAWFGLGSALNTLGRFEEAEEALNRAQALAPRHAGVENALGVARQNLGDDAGAAANFDAALAINPSSIAALINRSALRRSLGDLQGALMDADAALRAGSGSAHAHWQRGAALRALGRVEDAASAFEAALKIAPFNTEIQGEYASMRWEAGDASGYLAAIDYALAQQPEASLLVLKARLALRAGQGEIAHEAARRAADLAPNDPDAHGVLGEVLTLTQSPADGAPALRAAYDLDPASFEARHNLAEALIGAHEFEEAAALLEGDAPDSEIQRHTALKTLAWRALGDERYKRFYDYDLLTQKRFIETPPGYRDLEAFNAALAEEITALHSTQVRPLDQTLFGGTQSKGRLWNVGTPAIQALARALMKAGEAFVSGLPDDPDHPFLRRKSTGLRLTGAWSVRLQSGGGHVDHIHPAGWISASYYVQVPEGVRKDSHGGWLRLGASGVKGLDLEGERWIRPEAGSAIFFPSYLWHGVDPFFDQEPRITAPFDMVPV
jgi:uncharacterized protein (TIGR02466 family)